jgi:photosystem II stability/assembly factor-like uncharacterized protein
MKENIKISLSSISIITYSLLYITHVKGVFVIVGYNGIIFTSQDGFTWTKQSTGTNAYAFKNIVYTNNLFVAVKYGGIILTSPDGITWTK